jgi:myxalamid-type polyketide synthase MxaE and MxaD
MPKNPQDAATIEAWLVSKLSERLGIEPSEIDIREPLASYGLGSTEAVSLAGELAEWVGQQLPPALVYEYPTIEALARHLAGAPQPSTPDPAGGNVPVAKNEPIAIIGLGCRFPGAKDPSAFWELLRAGVDAIQEVPADRFDPNAFYDSDPAAPGKMNTRWGGFLEHVDQFDAAFFGISPREAQRMDPQQRLLLEVTWEALQDAGQVPEALAGTPAGVFIGIATNDYGRMQWDDLERIDAYAGTGNALSIAANRISYLFDFRGPSIAIDTACSSSLVAVHLACASLRNGESTLAVAGGVNLILSPAIAINFTKAGAMSPDGRCKSFDARANGYVRSEGAGVVVLKPLSKAVADGDPVYAVIRGSAINQDGRSNGLMAPNPQAQEAVLREAYRQAAVSPGDIQYVEAHGTGTLLGDPIEAKALGAVLGIDRPPGQRCGIGSVKSNLGHLEAAAGIAGLIKVALALKHREIPPSLHFEVPNPHIPFEDLPLRVQTALTPWPTESGPALAGVSSFGFGGTNAHVVVQEAPPPVAAANANDETIVATHLLPLSARSEEALQALAGEYRSLLGDPDAAKSLADICYSASRRRGHHDHRLALVGRSAADMVETLGAFQRGETRSGLWSGRKRSSRRRKLAFVFSGQGSQWLGMGRQLLEQEPVFREAIARCDLAMRPYRDWSLLAELSNSDAAQSRLNQVDAIQPALFAVHVGLVALWRSWGVEPQAVIGHSLGEAAAAFAAGALSLDDAMRVVCHRSRLFLRTVGRGAMAAVELSVEDAMRILRGFEDRVSIAANNGPSSTILSGDPAALETILDQLRRDDVFCRPVAVDFASHSPQMAPLRADLLEALAGLRPGDESIPIYSTVTGEIGHGPELDPTYWTMNMREPVLFSAAIQRMVEDGYDTFLEIGAHPILLGAMQQAFRHFGQECAALPSLRREEDGPAVMLGSLGALYTLGYPVDWNSIYPSGGRCVPLPAYPWQRVRSWFEPRTQDGESREAGIARPGANDHPLLGRPFRTPHADGVQFWEYVLDRTSSPHLDDHRIQGIAVLPASAYLEMALAATAETFGPRPIALKDIEFRRALFLPDGERRTVQTVMARDVDGTGSFYIYSRDGAGAPSGQAWTLHATGKVIPLSDAAAAADLAPETPQEMRARLPQTIAGPEYYRRLGERGVHYGSFYRALSAVWHGDESAVGEVQAPAGSDASAGTGRLHPAVLDAALQVFGAAIASGAVAANPQGLHMPTAIAELRVHGGAGSDLWSLARVSRRDGDGAIGEVRLVDDAGRIAAEITGLRFDYLGTDTHRATADRSDDWLYEFQWRLETPAANVSLPPRDPARWLIFADRGGVADGLIDLLEARGEACISVAPGDSFGRVDDKHFRIRPDRPEDIRQILASAPVTGQPVRRRIVHLWSLDIAPLEETGTASLDGAVRLGCDNVLLLAQELARIDGPDFPSLWLVTRGAQAAGDESSPISVAQSPLWGLGRVIAQEHPQIWGGLVDLDPGAVQSGVAAQQLDAEIARGDRDEQVAFRAGQRLVGRLARHRPTKPNRPAMRWRADGAYLISGGLGDLGLLVARRMVERGARRLILLGRTELPPRTEWSAAEPGSRLARQVSAIQGLEALGASVHLAPVDVADEGALEGFLKFYRAERWPPIRGVIHAAGVLRDGLIVQLDAAALDAVLRPKALGGWSLHNALRGEPLDFFVMFSSAGSVIGQPGQGNYAAANAFLDALAHHRRALGLPALSIDWGAWAGEGFADTAGGRRLAARLALMGIGSIEPRHALEALGRLLDRDTTQIVAVPVDWKRYRENGSAGIASPLLSELTSELAAAVRVSGHTSERRDALLAADPAERGELLRRYLTEQVARVLGISPSKLDLEQPLSNLGLDSLMAVELKNRIAMDLLVNVPIAKFLQGFSVDQAVTQVLEQLATEPSSPSMSPVSKFVDAGEEGDADRLLANLAQLSDEEVDALLNDILGNANADPAAAEGNGRLSRTGADNSL